MRILLAQTLLLVLLLCCTSVLAEPRPDVRLFRLPDGAIQPRLATDKNGVHLLYFQRNGVDGRSGHLIHALLDVDTGRIHGRTQVSEHAYPHNDQIGKADFAIDETGRVHVAWLDAPNAAYLYSRSIDGGSNFSRPRHLAAENPEGVEAEPSLAVHNDEVVVAWHAGSMAAEHARRVYAVRSSDGGATFSDEVAVSPVELGVCACCSMASAFDEHGNFRLAYRSAVEDTGRHMQLIEDGEPQAIGMWELDYCPVTSVAMTSDRVVFETAGRLMAWHAETGAKPVTSSPAAARQKHPSMAENARGVRLVVWAEADGYFSGGELRLAVFDPDDHRLAHDTSGPLSTIPEFSVAAAAAASDGSFVVVY